MKQLLLQLSLLAISAVALAQTTSPYAGNGASGYTGVVGLGTLDISDDGTNLNFVINSGASANAKAGATDINSTNYVVFYLDTKPGGVTSTSDLLPSTDPLQAAVAGNNGTTEASVDFPAGFGADFAILYARGGAYPYLLTAGEEVMGLGFNGQSASNGVLPFSLPRSTFDNPSEIKFVATTVFSDASTLIRYDELFGSDVLTGVSNTGSEDIVLTSFYTYTITSPLPVTLIDFTASAALAGVALEWSTASETDNAGFGVERSTDGTFWTEIAWVAGFGDSRQTRNYAFDDLTPRTAAVYYRLRQEDHDGATTYSSVVSVGPTTEVAAGLKVQSTVSAQAIRVQNLGAADRQVRLLNALGQEVSRVRVQGYDDVMLSTAGLASGIYLASSERETFKVFVP